MHRSTAPLAALVLFVTGAPLVAEAQAATREQCEQRYSPRVGQDGKDVIWVPTSNALAVEMLRAVQTTPQDVVVDLGAGDGKLAITAAKEFGARARGVEYNPALVKLARCYVEAEGLQDKVEIVQGDIFETDFSDATVLTLYLLSDLNLRLRPTILNLKPGVRVVSNTFKMGDWSPDAFVASPDTPGRAYVWIVPAKVAGLWRFRQVNGPHAFRLRLEQHHQELKGVVLDLDENGEQPISAARLQGAGIELTLPLHGAAHRLSGEVQGGQIAAVVQRDGSAPVSYMGVRGLPEAAE